MRSNLVAMRSSGRNPCSAYRPRWSLSGAVSHLSTPSVGRYVHTYLDIYQAERLAHCLEVFSSGASAGTHLGPDSTAH